MKKILILSFLITCVFPLISQIKGDEIIVRKIDVSSLIKSIHNSRSNVTKIKLSEGQDFEISISENTILGEEFQKANPNIKTYNVVNDKGELCGSFTLGENVIHASYSTNQKFISIYPDYKSQSENMYTVEYGRKAIPFGMCKAIHEEGESYDLSNLKKLIKNRAEFSNTTPFRIAIVVTGEFFKANGNNNSLVNAAVAASVNGVSAIYTKQYGIIIRLIGTKIFNDPATDPFIPDENAGAPGRTEQAGTEVPKHFNANTFDIGHVLHTTMTDDGWSSGGVAQLKSVCDNFTNNGQLNKASGWSGSFNNTGHSWFSLFAHEVGHQFGMRHTFNGTGESCTDNIATTNAVEIGSGTTIMSYNGICDPSNNIPNNGELDNYFHYMSTQDMIGYLIDEVPTCLNPTPTTNYLPEITANPCGASYILPKGTPYYLKADAVDEGNDILYYAWEQFDEDGPGKPTQGLIGSAASGQKLCPLMKCNPPSIAKERYFPDMPTIVKGNNSDVFQVLANTNRLINFGVSVRDNVASGGGIAYEEVQLSVQNTGPLTVTYPNNTENLNAGQTINVTWSIGGSEELCENAGIYLSLDGGLSYSLQLASNVNYDLGSFQVQIPPFLTKTNLARIKVACDDYDCFKFFDISNSNFNIESQCEIAASVICPSNNITLPKGDAGLNLALENINGKRVTSFLKLIVESPSNISPTPVFNTNNTGCSNEGNAYSTFTLFSVEKSGTYTFTVDREYQDNFGFVTIVNNETYNPNSPCSAFVSSSGRDANPGGVFALSTMTAQLEECTTYRMLFFNYADNSLTSYSTSVPNVNGPGRVYELNSTGNQDYSYTYIAVRNSNNVIAAVSPDSDFRSLSPGEYTVYGFSYKSGGSTPPSITDPNNYLNMEFNSFYIPGDCFLTSENSFQLIVDGSCNLENASLGNKSACNPADNTFTQEIVLTYLENIAGKVVVGNTEYDISASPQTILYTGQSDGTITQLDIYPKDDPGCKKQLSIEHPQNCCPFEIGVKNEERGCQGIPLEVKATPGLGTYKWFDKDGIEISTSSSITVSVASDYRVEVTSSTGCKKTQNFKTFFEATPNLSLPEDVTICDGVDFQLLANTNASFIEWYKNDVLITSGPSKSITINEAGNYKAKAGNSALCQVEDEIVISTKPSPKPNLGQDKNICEGSSTKFSVTDNGTITWFFNNTIITGQTGKEITVSEEGIYKVKIEGSNGCSNEDMANVVVYALPVVDAGMDAKFCDGKNTTITATSSTQNFQWFRNDQAFPESELSFTTTLDGEFKIVASNEIGCSVRDSIKITKNAKPVINLPNDTITGCIGTTIILEGPTGNGFSYIWTRNGSPAGNTKDITVSTPGAYALIITDANQCTNNDVANVNFKNGPTINFNEIDIEICEGETFDLIATTTATKLEWLKDGVKINGQTSKTLKINSAGKYKLKATGIVGTGGSECTAELEANAIINPTLKVNVNDTTACEGESLTLTSNVNAQNYLWTLNGTQVGTTKTYKPTIAGTYTLQVTSNKGCKSSDNVAVTFSSRPSITVPATGGYCKGEVLNLTAQSNGTAFKWFRGTTSLNITIKTIEISVPGSYIVEASFNGSCPKRDTIVVSEQQSPIVNLGADKILCPKDSLTLDAQNSGSKYLWSTGDTTKTIKLKNSGISKEQDINVQVTNQFNCKSNDLIKITFRPEIELKLTSSAPGICGGDSVIITGSGALIYNWEGPTNTFNLIANDKIVVFPGTTSTYTLIGSDNCPNNRDTLKKEIRIFALPKISAGNDTCAILGRSIKLKASGGASYSWEDDVTIVSGKNTASPTIQPTEEQSYYVTIKDANGCTQIDSVKVCIIEDPLKLLKEINMITPNGDGSNDELIFQGLEAFPDNQLTVYNRWGNIVFEKLRYQQDGELFNGTRNGEELPPDTYYYVLKFDEYVFKQSLTIIRQK